MKSELKNTPKTFAVGILYNAGKFLAERRRMTENYFPGAIIFPGGHVEGEESPENALIREMKEELDIIVEEYVLVGEFIHSDGSKNVTFLIKSWHGDPKPIEAESLFWIKNADELTNKLDREMLEAVQSILK
jgi:8-oxo-dGTP diphosphatase